MELSEILKDTDLLSEVPIDRIRGLLGQMEEVLAAPGTVIFGKGDVGDAVYLIVDGAVRIESDGVPIATLGPRRWVGEIALVDDGPRSAAVVATCETRLLRWNRDNFRRVMTEQSEVATGILRILSRKVRDTVDIQVELALQQERWRQDLRRAREIQMGMLPAGAFTGNKIEVAALCRPAAEVGGDYYDYVLFDNDRIGLIIGDVTGHGFYSGLFVAMAKSCLNTQVSMDYAPHKVMEAMGRTLSLSIQRSLLMSCCYVLCDPRSGILTFANAGHPYPYLYSRRTERLQKLDAIDPLLGIQDLFQCEFHYERRDWESGDLLVFYSDGITEARNEDGRMFGNERLERAIVRNCELSAGALKEVLLNEVTTHSRGIGFDDDLTLMVAKAL